MLVKLQTNEKKNINASFQLSFDNNMSIKKPGRVLTFTLKNQNNIGCLNWIIYQESKNVAFIRTIFLPSIFAIYITLSISVQSLFSIAFW